MMKKIFTLLTLALLSIGSAWAGEVNTTLISGISLPSLPTGTYTGGTTVVHNGSNKAVVVDANNNGIMQASAPGYGSPTGDFSWTNAANGETDASWSTTGTTWDASGIFAGSTAYTTSGNAHYVNFARRGNLRTNRTFAYRFTNCAGVSALVKSQGTSDDAAACLAVYEVEAGSTLTHVGTASSKAKAADIITVDGLTLSKTYVAYIYGMNGSNGELYEVGFLAPAEKIGSTPSSITLNATESGVAVNSSFTITGSKLTPGTYDLTIPSVSGLTVSPTSFTVAADGTVSQVVNVSYSSTENVEANTVNITSTVGAVSLNVPVTYSANVTTWTLQSISTETVWDFSTKVSGSKQYEGDDVNVEHVYANISELSFSEGFNQYALAFTGQFPFRDNSHKYAQAGTLHFNTTVPGTIIVKFSDTGTSASATAVKRYLVVNGNTTEYWTSRQNNGTENPYAAQLNVTTDEIAVPAGDVTITGTSGIIMSYVKFIPAEHATISSAGYATFVPSAKVSVPTGVKAYIVTATSANTATLSVDDAITVIPAGEPVIIKGDEGTYYFTQTTDEASSVTGNELKTGAVASADGTQYILANGGSGVGFYKATPGTAIAEGKAYLVSPSGAPCLLFNFFDDMQTTGVNDVRGKMADVRGDFFDLQGRKVANPTKGLYIVNGKKVIVK